MKYELISTKDKSNTLYLPHLNEHYHSIHGALTESEHIYINNGLEPLKEKRTLNVLEIGFGTGLNAILSLLWANRNKVKIHYSTLEPFPIPIDIIKQLNFINLIPLMDTDASNFIQMHEIAFNQEIELSTYFSFIKKRKTFQEFQTKQNYNVIYYDAFAPEKQPNMWTTECFEKLASLLKSGGILPTYCCKGTVKRAFKAVGLAIEKKPGPKRGKREMLVVTK